MEETSDILLHYNEAFRKIQETGLLLEVSQLFSLSNNVLNLMLGIIVLVFLRTPLMYRGFFVGLVIWNILLAYYLNKSMSLLWLNVIFVVLSSVNFLTQWPMKNLQVLIDNFGQIGKEKLIRLDKATQSEECDKNEAPSKKNRNHCYKVPRRIRFKSRKSSYKPKVALSVNNSVPDSKGFSENESTNLMIFNATSDLSENPFGSQFGVRKRSKLVASRRVKDTQSPPTKFIFGTSTANPFSKNMMLLSDPWLRSVKDTQSQPTETMFGASPFTSNPILENMMPLRYPIVHSKVLDTRSPPAKSVSELSTANPILENMMLLSDPIVDRIDNWEKSNGQKFNFINSVSDISTQTEKLQAFDGSSALKSAAVQSSIFTELHNLEKLRSHNLPTQSSSDSSGFNNQCQGTTLQGLRCRNRASLGYDACYHHNGSRLKLSTPVRNYPSGQCHGITLKGLRCKNSSNCPHH